MMNFFCDELKKLKEENLYRERRIIKDEKIFCSNDYLGLSKNEEVIAYVIDVIKKEGIGATGSSLVSGYTAYHELLEYTLATFKKTEKCILFPSGYSTNIGLLQSLATDKDVFYSDELNHASIIDGIKLSKASKYIYKHKDINNLFELLSKTRKNYKNAYIVSDSIFSMEGDIAPLRDLLVLSKDFNTFLILDEAHATGTIGFGIFDYFKLLPEQNVILMGTLSKAIGSQGGFVCANDDIINYIVNKARSYIFSTALGLPMVVAAIKSLELISKKLEYYIKNLKEKTNDIFSVLCYYKFNAINYGTPIIPIKIGKEEYAIRLRDELLKRNIYVQAIRYPTVPRDKAMLRLTSSLSYTDEDLEMLFSAFENISSQILW